MPDDMLSTIIAKSALVEYHKYKVLPDNFLAIGDSASVTNPVYGWGIAKAGVMAVTLAGMLDRVEGTEIPRGFAKEYFASNELRTSWTWCVSLLYRILFLC